MTDDTREGAGDASQPRTLGLDFGTKRIGLALADNLYIAAHPLTTVARKGSKADAAEIARIAAEHSVGRVIVGLPLGLDGSKGPRAKQTEAFIQVLAAALGPDVAIETWDERFSTVEASRGMKAMGVSRARRDARIDQEAAAVILQGWLDARRGRG